MAGVKRREALRILMASAAAIPVALSSTKKAEAATHHVTIGNFGFEPDRISVSPRDTVVFTNRTRQPHSATAKMGHFDTGTIEPGGSGSVKIRLFGQYEYFSKHSRFERGTIIVR